jgi:hypothetical protein
VRGQLREQAEGELAHQRRRAEKAHPLAPHHEADLQPRDGAGTGPREPGLVAEQLHRQCVEAVVVRLVELAHRGADQAVGGEAQAALGLGVDHDRHRERPAVVVAEGQGVPRVGHHPVDEVGGVVLLDRRAPGLGVERGLVLALAHVPGAAQGEGMGHGAHQMFPAPGV